MEEKVRELKDQGYCVLPGHFARSAIGALRDAFWPALLAYLERHAQEPNRGPHRHFLPMPFDPPCFAPDFFFDAAVLGILRDVMDDRIVADQWGCDVPLRGSEYQEAHVDYRRPLFGELPDLALPPYMMVVSFGLVRITADDGPIEIAPGTHRMPKNEALRALDAGDTAMRPVPLEIGDVLIRHPWALHRGTPNTSDTPRALVGIRYVRRWYADDSREVQAVPSAVWRSLTPEQRSLLRLPVGE
jgi:hypothetical protein